MEQTAKWHLVPAAEFFFLNWTTDCGAAAHAECWAYGELYKKRIVQVKDHFAFKTKSLD
jgi:hypothetical protein